MAGVDVKAFDLTEELTFHGVEYYLRAYVRDSTVLVVEAEHKHDDERWVTEFTKDDIQRMTESTKNYKAFEVFVNMLAGAMRGDNDSVFIDLLTYADLQMLKARKTGKTPPKAPDAPQKNNKRYLILTYVVQFDRVHYPLPLKHEAEPSVGSLQQTVQRLRYQLEAHTHTDGKRSQEQRSQQDVQRVMQENHKLKQLLADRNADDDAFEQDQDTIAALEQENDELRRELDNRPDAPTSADRRKLEDARVNAKQVKLLQKQIDSLKDNLRKEKALNAKVQSKFKREYKQLSNDVDKLRTSEARFRQQTKKLTGELASVRAELKRANSSAAAAARVSRRNKTTNASARNRSLSRGSSTSRRASPSPGAHNRSSSRSNAKSNTSTSARSRSRGAFGSSSNLSASGRLNRTSARSTSRTGSRTRSATPPVRRPVRSRIDTGRNTRRSPSPYTRNRSTSRPRPGSAASSRGGVPTGQRSSSRGRAARPSSSYATRPYGSTARGSTSKARGSSRSRNTSKENVRPGNSARGRSTSKGRGRTPDSGRSSKRAAQDLGEPVIPTWGPEGEDSLSQSTFHASQDIADIDSRINKLQSFLKMAKSGSMR